MAFVYFEKHLIAFNLALIKSHNSGSFDRCLELHLAGFTNSKSSENILKIFLCFTSRLHFVTQASIIWFKHDTLK